MTAILFGSIGTLADTSELQREAFNAAFAEHGLDWAWSQDEYRRLLVRSGGAQRIADYAESRGEQVDAAAVHATKSRIFQERLRDADLTPRPDVVATIAAAREAGAKLGLVTTTTPENVAALGEALAGRIDLDHFDVVLDLTMVEQSKPAPDVYELALARLGEPASAALAIEDNVGGVRAAADAGVTVIAFPGANNADHDFSAASDRVETLGPDALTVLKDRS